MQKWSTTLGWEDGRPCVCLCSCCCAMQSKTRLLHTTGVGWPSLTLCLCSCIKLYNLFSRVCVCVHVSNTRYRALLPHKMGVGWPSLSTTGCLRPSKEHRPCCSSKFRVTLHSSQVPHFPSSVYNAFIQIFSMYFSYFVLHTIEPYE